MKSTLLLMPPITGPVAAGAPSGVDPTAIESCLRSAQTDGGRIDCAGAQTRVCEALIAKRYPQGNAINRTLGCIDAETQVWESFLGEGYASLKKAERAAALTRMELDWITYRDARCGYDKQTNGGGTGGVLAQPSCLMNETARQVVLLRSYLRDKGM